MYQGAPRDTTLHAVRLGRPVGGAEPQFLQEDLFAQSDDVLLVQSDGTNAPEVGDAILIDGAPSRIIEVNAVQPGGIAVLYRVGLKGN